VQILQNSTTIFFTITILSHTNYDWVRENIDLRVLEEHIVLWKHKTEKKDGIRVCDLLCICPSVFSLFVM
jgi:hypothetical protein